MKRMIGFCIGLFLFAVMTRGLSGTLTAQTAESEWLILVYVNAVNDRGLDGSAMELIRQLRKEGSGDKVTVLVQYGILQAGPNKELQFPDRTETLLVRKDPENAATAPTIMDSSPVRDMASGTSLYLFARKGIMQYPSKRVLLLFFGKGEGRGELGRDDLSGKTMSVDILAETLGRIRKATGKKIDLLVLDAGYAQTAENIYALRDEADLIVGSEGQNSRVGYLYDLVLQDVKEDPAMDSGALAGSFVSYSENPVCSAVDTVRIPGFLSLLDRWVDAVTGDPAAMKTAAETARTAFSFTLKDSKDLCDYVERVSGALPEGHAAVPVGKELCRYILDMLVIASHKTYLDADTGKITPEEAYKPARGLAIYLPELRYDSEFYERLEFASRFEWGRFLRELLAVQLNSR
jgi:hypothetical protein